MKRRPKTGVTPRSGKRLAEPARALHDFRQFGMHAGEDASVAAHGRHIFKAVGLAAPVAIVSWRNCIESIAAFACGESAHRA